MQTETPVNPEALWRLAPAASMARLSPHMVESVINSGQIPGASIVKLGPRGLKHIARPDLFYAWSKGHGTTADASHAPAPSCADLF